MSKTKSKPVKVKAKIDKPFPPNEKQDKAGGGWIAGAISKPGALTAQAKKAGKTPAAFAKANKSAPGKTGRRARLALLLMSFAKKRAGKKKP